MPDRNALRKPYIYRLSISSSRGDKKRNVKSVKVTESGGLEGDAHADTFRAISLLPYESFSSMKGFGLEINPGDFAENITTVGMDLAKLSVGDRISLGESVVLTIVQLGKECHDACSIGQAVGDCIMPREGVFARAVTAGLLREGDPITILGPDDPAG